MEYFTFYNGCKMPALGLGLFLVSSTWSNFNLYVYMFVILVIRSKVYKACKEFNKF